MSSHQIPHNGPDRWIRLKQKIPCRSVFIFLSLIGVFLGSFAHHWDGYLLTANRSELPWDPAMHFMDGFKLYQTGVTGDVPSFLYHFISFGFWMPLHPLLVALSNLFFPAQIEPAVYINYLVVAGGLAASILMLSGSLSSSWTKPTDPPATLKELFRPRSFGLVGLLWVAALLLHRISRQPDWVGLMNVVMLEMTAFSLTLVHCIAGALYAWRREPRFFKYATLSLFGLFTTKIHYGILVAPTFFVMAGMLERGSLAACDQIWLKPTAVSQNWLQWLQSLWARRYFRAIAAIYATAIALLSVRLISGKTEIHLFSQRISVSGMGNFIWILLWLPLLVWTIELVRKRNPFYLGWNWAWKYLHNFCLLPFAWYYLFPFRHKIGAFLYNLHYTENTAPPSFAEKTRHFPTVLFQGYWGLESLTSGLIWVMALIAVIGMRIAIARKTVAKSPLITAGLFLTGNLATFYVLMTFFNGYRDNRMAITWVAQFFAFNLFVAATALDWIGERIAAGMMEYRRLISALAVSVGLGALSILADQWRNTSPAIIRQITTGVYLPSNYRGFDYIVANFDPSRPGIIFGLGMDLGNPVLTLRLMAKYRWSNSVFFRDRPFINDLGKRGNEDPLGFIRDQITARKIRQLVLFKLSLKPEWIDELTRIALADPASGIRIRRETADYVYLSD